MMCDPLTFLFYFIFLSGRYEDGSKVGNNPGSLLLDANLLLHD